MTPRERAEMVRGAARLLPKTVARNGLRIEFDAEPALITNKVGAVVGVDAMVRVFRGATELQVDPHRICINPPTKVPDGTFGDTPDGPVSNFRDDPVEAYLSWLVDSLRATPNPKGWRTKGTVTTVFGDTSDGRLISSNASYATARAGSGVTATTADATRSMGQNLAAGPTYQCFHNYFAFDTSSIADTDTVSASELALYGSSDSSTTDFTIQARLYDWGATLEAADWRTDTNAGSDTLLATFATSGFSTAGYNAFTESSGALSANINKTGTTRLYCVSSRFVSATAPTGAEFVQVYMADQAGTTNDPKLTVTHAAAAKSYSFGVAIG